MSAPPFPELKERPLLLEVKDLQSGYDGHMVLRGVSMSLKPASVTVVLGPNGVGKTTLLKSISGLLRPGGGQINLNGTDVTRSAAHRRAAGGVCHIPEGRGIYRSLTVRDNLIMQANRGSENEGVERAAAAFPILGKRISQLAGTLSGGEQQMLALARAYVRRPQLLLVDEPSLGLAPLVVDLIFEHLRQLATEGIALLLVDQLAHRLLEMADHAYLLARGTFQYDGPAKELAGQDVFAKYLGPTQ